MLFSMLAHAQCSHDFSATLLSDQRLTVLQSIFSCLSINTRLGPQSYANWNDVFRDGSFTDRENDYFADRTVVSREAEVIQTVKYFGGT
jgi:hypothetical protein